MLVINFLGSDISSLEHWSPQNEGIITFLSLLIVFGLLISEQISYPVLRLDFRHLKGRFRVYPSHKHVSQIFCRYQNCPENLDLELGVRSYGRFCKRADCLGICCNLPLFCKNCGKIIRCHFELIPVGNVFFTCLV